MTEIQRIIMALGRVFDPQTVEHVTSIGANVEKIIETSVKATVYILGDPEVQSRAVSEDVAKAINFYHAKSEE